MHRRRALRASRRCWSNSSSTLRAAGVPVIDHRVPDAARGAASARRVRRRRGFLLPGARLPGEGRAPLRPLRPRLRHVFPGRRDAPSRSCWRRFPAEWLQQLGDARCCPRRRSAASRRSAAGTSCMETLRAAAAEQKERHEGGNKWIGTGGTSPFGAHGYNPEGVRIGQDGSRQPPRRQGLGPARVPQPRRRGRARHAQPQARAAPAAQVRARGRGRRARSRRHHRCHRAQRRPARPEAWCRSGTTR